MTRKLMLLAALTILAATGCSGDKGKELFDTAQFEEKQHNPDHARQLYEELVKKYPDSPLAQKARERLTAIGAK
jgi:TolA-binding protein